MAGTEPMALEDVRVDVVDAAAEGVLTPEQVAPPAADELRELRLALVCYGGVSLAIYMHGVTKELNKLVIASTAYEGDEHDNPFDADDSAHEYWELLRKRHEDTGLRTRVVIDIVSGASAGGINGVFLATAIARNRPQDPLRRLWLERGDIKKLLAGPRWLPAFAKAALFLYNALRHPLSTRPPLRGDDMCRWLNEAFDEMDTTSRQPLADLASLIPRGQRLQLFVPITDFTGYDVRIPLDDPAWISDRTHRHVMRFIHDGRDQQQLSPDWNDALAFSARASSSFPGAFPPLSIADFERDVGGRRLAAEVQETLFPGHFLADRDPRHTHFIDGGVLDNKPFRTTLDAIKLRPAASEVDRRLLYIEPDPGPSSDYAPDGRTPGWLPTIVNGYAGIPRKEPILDDLNDLTRHNGDVERVRDIIESSFGTIRDRVLEHIVPGSVGGDSVVPVVDAQQLTIWREQLTEAADHEAGFGYPTYLRLRVRAVIEDYAALISTRRNYPAGSTHAEFVRRVVRAWAISQGLLDRRPEASQAQRRFVESLDIGFEDRHLRFAIAGLSWWYRGDAEQAPDRQQLDRAKYELYRRLDALQDVALGLTRNVAVSDLIGKVLSKSAIDEALRRNAPAEEVVADHGDTLARLSSGVTSLVGDQLASLRVGIDEDLARLTEAWTPWARGEMLVRHLAFRFWDVLVYPVEALSGVNERDHVEVMRVSPHEATTIVANAHDKDLKGVTLGHFGAFFSRKGRENDYLWGRLDGADRLSALLHTSPGSRIEPPPTRACKPLFDTILREEAGALTNIADVIKRMRVTVRELD